MKRLLILALVGLMLAGCSGVIMSPTYSSLLDKWVAISEADATRAVNKTFDANDMTSALIDQYAAFKQFQDARDGKESAAPSDVEKAIKNASGPK
jgi:cytochrome oxidase Cu insertion factor (SCO1/SenC/PrrC family)